jgi:ABC-type amino acid transport system permease subunit
LDDKQKENLDPILSPDEKARHRGRMGLAIPWEHMPWWVIITAIIAIIVFFSIVNNEYYRSAFYFIFDLPWNQDVIQNISGTKIKKDGSWTYTLSTPMDPGNYTFWVEYYGEDKAPLGKEGPFKFEIPEGAPEEKQPPLEPSDEYILLSTSTPTLSGTAPSGTKNVILIDDFSGQPLRILERIWNARGVMMTIKVTIISFLVALLLGLVFGIMRVSDGSPDLRPGIWKRLGFGVAFFALLMIFIPEWRTLITGAIAFLVVEAIFVLLPAMPYTLSTLYVEIVRGVPMLVIILYMGFAVTPALRNATNGNIDLRGLPAAVIGLSFGYGAYMAEVFRAGIQSIPKGQMEAARSIGMTYFQAMRLVILPQAIRLILPPLGNDLIAMLKDTSLISVIALPEMLQSGRLWISRNFRAFEGFNSVMILYLIMTLFLSMMVRVVERRSKLPSK